MSLLHKALAEILKPLQSAGRMHSEERQDESRLCISRTLLGSYFWDMPEGKDLSCKSRGIAVNLPFVRCLAKMGDIQNLLGCTVE